MSADTMRNKIKAFRLLALSDRPISFHIVFKMLFADILFTIHVYVFNFNFLTGQKRGGYFLIHLFVCIG